MRSHFVHIRTAARPLLVQRLERLPIVIWRAGRRHWRLVRHIGQRILLLLLLLPMMMMMMMRFLSAGRLIRRRLVGQRCRSGVRRRLLMSATVVQIDGVRGRILLGHFLLVRLKLYVREIR